MRKSNEEMKNYLLDKVAELEYTSTYAFAIRENGMVKACIVENANEVLPMVTYCERNAESHGGVWGVRMNNTKQSFEILKTYASKVVTLCSIDYLETRYAMNKAMGKGNRGNIFEELLVANMGGYQVENKNAKFTDCGDVVIDDMHIQCKLWNATITTEPTIRNFLKKALDK